jgi:hypothetical protein
VEQDEQTAERLRRLGSAARDAEEAWGVAREARDRAVIEADDAGWKYRPIAREVGLALSHVQRIVVAQTERRQDAALEAPGID